VCSLQESCSVALVIEEWYYSWNFFKTDRHSAEPPANDDHTVLRGADIPRLRAS
jgi:hypothetical protein